MKLFVSTTIVKDHECEICGNLVENSYTYSLLIKSTKETNIVFFHRACLLDEIERAAIRQMKKDKRQNE